MHIIKLDTFYNANLHVRSCSAGSKTKIVRTTHTAITAKHYNKQLFQFS